MSANFLSEAEVVAQLDAQHTKYTADPALVGSDVQADHDARVTAANATHTEVTNSTFATLNSNTVSGGRGVVNAEVYSGANVVVPVNATFAEAAVRTALDADSLFAHGGPYGAAAAYDRPSPYVDGLTLIEGSKLTGEKFY